MQKRRRLGYYLFGLLTLVLTTTSYGAVLNNSNGKSQAVVLPTNAFTHSEIAEAKPLAPTIVSQVLVAQLNGGVAPPVANPTVDIPDGANAGANGTNGELSITVSGSPERISEVGQRVTYVYNVTNVSDVPLTNVAVFDTLFTRPVCLVGLLSPSFTAICTAIYFATEEDVHVGSINNIATTMGDQVEAPADAGFTVGENGGPGHTNLVLTRSIEPSTFSTLGEKIVFTDKVTNTGSEPQHNVEVVDDFLNSVCRIGLLWTNKTAVCTGVHFVKTEDLERGEVGGLTIARSDENPAPVRISVSASSNPIPRAPGLNLSVAPSILAYSAPGQIIDYEIVILNLGNESLTNVVVRSSLQGGVVCVLEEMPSNTDFTCRTTYTVSDTDVSKNGLVDQITNTVLVTSNETATPVEDVSTVFSASRL